MIGPLGTRRAMDTPVAEAMRWWRGDGALHRYVCDLVAGELGRLRPGAGPSLAQRWPTLLPLDDDGLGADSLELLSLGAALAEALHLQESGIEDHLLTRRTIGDWVAIASAGLEHFHARLTFRTSGSTGKSKACQHTLDALLQETVAQVALLGTPKRIISAVPCHHVYGFLFTILLPRYLGGVPVVDVRGSSPGHLGTTLKEGDLVVGHPDFWRAVARAVPHVRAGVVGVTSAAACPIETAEAMAGLGLERLLQIYGSSETAGVAWRDGADQPYQLYPYWRRHDAGAVVRVADEAIADMPPCDLPDRLEWLDDRHFHLTGRLDNAVQVAGINVFPERVRQCLCEHPAVKQAVVRLMGQNEGSRLKAFIVADDGIDLNALRADLTTWIDSRLTTPERPRALTFGASLPCGSMGKASDWTL